MADLILLGQDRVDYLLAQAVIAEVGGNKGHAEALLRLAIRHEEAVSRG